MEPIKHFSIDLETLGISRRAVILTVAIVTDRGDTLVMAPSIDQQIRDGRVVDGETFRWWLKQSAEARASIADVSESPCHEVRRAVAKMFGQARDSYFVWGNAPSFDCEILADFLGTGTCAMERPWSIWMERDVRTARMAVGRTQPEVAHDALADAAAQLADAIKFTELALAQEVNQ